jgi:DNA-binding GntR family transcriptional regulator
MTFETSPFSSKADYITQELRRRIADGTLKSGAELRQRTLAQQFGVSATPVREALSRLHAEGYVETRLHRGATVVRAASERRSENWRIRCTVESLAVELACERLNDADRSEIDELAREFAQAKEPAEAAEANRRFHFRIYEAARSPVLLRFLEALWISLDVSPSTLRRHEVSTQQHFAIAEALRRGDVEGAAALTRRHISETAASALGSESAPDSTDTDQRLA